MGDQVQNRYRQAIGDALPGLRRQAGLVDSVFDTVQSALRGGAWTSTVADAFATYDTRIEGQKVKFQFNVKNLFDRTYYTSAASRTFVSIGDSRQFTLSSTLEF